MNGAEIGRLEEALRNQPQLFKRGINSSREYISILPDREKQPDLDVPYIEIVKTGGRISMESVMNAVHKVVSDMRDSSVLDYKYPQLEFVDYSASRDEENKGIWVKQSWVYFDTDFE